MGRCSPRPSSRDFPKNFRKFSDKPDTPPPGLLTSFLKGVFGNHRPFPSTNLGRTRQWTSQLRKCLGKASPPSNPARRVRSPAKGSPTRKQASKEGPLKGNKSPHNSLATCPERSEDHGGRPHGFRSVHQDAPFGATGAAQDNHQKRQRKGASAQAEVDTSALEAENPVPGPHRRTQGQDPQSRPGKAKPAPAPRRTRINVEKESQASAPREGSAEENRQDA